MSGTLHTIRYTYPMHPTPAGDGSKPAQPELFRVGPGYLAYWAHIATHHNTLSDREYTVVTAFISALGQLLRHRNAIESARRGAIAVSPLDLSTRPDENVRADLINATKDFFLNFYSAVSEMASLMKRFPKVFINPPHASNERFLEWMKRIALFADRWDTLRAARNFRTLIDHPASKQPYEWATGHDGSGILRAGILGAAGKTGNIPTGAQSAADTPLGEKGVAWTFVAPDEDEVLTLLAVQLNVIVQLIQKEHYNPDSLPCAWEPQLGNGDPEGGYPMFAIDDGVVAKTGPMTPDLSEGDRKRIEEILAPYIEEIRTDPAP
ncbi:hypothetical protein ACEK07_44930 [Alcanivoracaceae bacterium MT1]